MARGITRIPHLPSLVPGPDGPVLGVQIGVDANGLPVGLFVGQATSDGTITTAVGADTLWADGSLYVSAVDGAGKLFQKQNDIWVDLQA